MKSALTILEEESPKDFFRTRRFSLLPPGYAFVPHANQYIAILHSSGKYVGGVQERKKGWYWQHQPPWAGTRITDTVYGTVSTKREAVRLAIYGDQTPSSSQA